MALLENIQNFFRDTLSTISAKNADYAKPEATGDEYFNFVATAFIHRVSPQTVIAMEITKKAIRLANLADGTSPATGEAVEDTLRDIIGYAAIYRSFELDEKNPKGDPEPNPTPDDIDVAPANENKDVNETPQTLSAEVKSALLRLLTR